MKQEMNQMFSLGIGKYNQNGSNRQCQVSLLDIQSDCTTENNNYGNILRMQCGYIDQNLNNLGVKPSKFQEAIGMENFTQFLESEMKESVQPKTKRPRTLIHHQKLYQGYMNNDNIMMVLQSSPNNALRGESQDFSQINVRSFQSKFIRQLNFKDNQRLRKNKKRLQINKQNETNISQNQQKPKKSPKPHNKKQLQQIWHNGTRVLSQFKNDIIHGETQIFYPNGAKFNGKYDHGVRIYGQFDFNNGYSYSGGFWGDKFQGQGQLTLPNGKSFSGDWVDHQLSGKVEIKYPSGDLYYGEIQNFKKHGKGYLFFKNGEKFVGQFQNGNITGKGEYFIDEQCVGRGIWKNGELVQKIQDNEEFEFFDTASYVKKQIERSQNTQKNQKISSNHDLDFVELDGLDEDEELYVKGSQRMINFKEIEFNRQRTKKNTKINVMTGSLRHKNVVLTNNFSKENQNSSVENRSQKPRSLKRKASEDTKQAQSQRIYKSDTFDEGYFHGADITQMLKNLKSLSSNMTGSQTQLTGHKKTSSGKTYYTSQHSQNSQQQWVGKTGKFISLGSMKKSLS